jgi:outer membrane protein assembly factor BamB
MTTELEARGIGPAAHAASDQHVRRMPLGFWIMAAILAAYWLVEFSIYSIEMAMFPRFITRMIVLLVVLVSFLGWWLTNRHLLWRDRLLGLVLLVGATTMAWLLAEQSARMVVVMAGLPRIFTAWTLWLLVSRNTSLALQRAGVLIGTFLVLGYFTLVRWDGLDGAQRAKLSWRWTPTAEQQFLATAATHRLTPDATAPAALRSGEPSERPNDGSVSATPWTLQSGDWPDFRSDQRDGGLAGVATSDGWSKQPPLVWRRRVGPGWSSMIVVDGHLVTQEQRGGSEAIVCYEATSGKELWAHEDVARFEEPLAGAGPRATPTFSGGQIFALGAKGKLNCLRATTGGGVWTREPLDEAGAAVPQWGLSVSPLVVDDIVIVFAGGKKGRSLAAYRADSGEPVWAAAAGDMSYSSPQLVTLAGERQILMHDDMGLHAVGVEAGQRLWEQTTGGGGAMPMLQPHVISQNELLVASGTGVALLKVTREGDRWPIETRWSNTSLKPDFNDFVTLGDAIYGLDDGILCCLDLQSGRRLWKKGRYGHGQLLLLASPARLLVISETGEVALVAASPEKHEELGRFKAIEGKTWNHPIVAHGCLFVRNGEEMACYRLAAE